MGEHDAAKETFYLETLGCPKNRVDSEKIAHYLRNLDMKEVSDPSSADMVVLNTCAFIEAARQESIETILSLAEKKQKGARLVVSGCLAERYGQELADNLPEVDLVAGFGVPVNLRPASKKRFLKSADLTQRTSLQSLDLLELPRSSGTMPWAYVKAAEGCDRNCGFCAIPGFRGKQRSRSMDSILAEVADLNSKEIVLVAQDLASYGKDLDTENKKNIVDLFYKVAEQVPWVRLLYLYPTSISDDLVKAILSTEVPYFDLSLQHSSRVLLQKMRRSGHERYYLELIDKIRDINPEAVFRSSFVIGYPGETEADQDGLLRFIERAELDWAGFFAYSKEEGTYAYSLGEEVDEELCLLRLRECQSLQDEITAKKRQNLVGTDIKALVDEKGWARSFREAPEIDGKISVPRTLETGSFVRLRITDTLGMDLVGEPVSLAQNLQGGA